jgi:putative copper export protein
MLWIILSFHLLGAAIWTGGHLVLISVVLPRALKARDTGILLRFEQGYERIGMPALLVQVITGLWLAWQLVPPGGWLSFADPTSTAVGIKLGLLAATALIALHARFRVIPRLNTEALPLMAWHAGAVTMLSILFVLTGAWIRTGGL